MKSLKIKVLRLTSQLISLLCLVALTSPLMAQLTQQRKQQIYSEYSLKTIPDEYVFLRNRMAELNKSIDSILCLRISDTGIEGPYETKEDSVRYYRVLQQPNLGHRFDSLNKGLIQLNKCRELAFLSFESRYGLSINESVNFRNFPNLLEFSLIKLQKISDQQLVDMFRTAKNLRGLSLPARSSIPEGFCELKNIEYLETTGEALLALKPNCLSQFSKLKYLKIHNYDSLCNKIVWNIPSLQVLIIEKGNDVIIPSSISSMQNLKHLSIQGVEKVVLPSEIGSLKSLEVLSLSKVFRPITFPESFKNLISLRCLHINDASLESFPVFSDGNNLEFLLLQSILGIRHYDPNVTNLIHLKRLELDHGIEADFIDGFPVGLGNLKELVDLRIDDYGLNDTLPPNFSELKNLTYFKLTGESTFEVYKQVYQLPQIKVFSGILHSPEYRLSNEQKAELLKIRGKLLPNKIGKGYDYQSTLDYYPSLIKDRIVLPRSY